MPARETNRPIVSLMTHVASDLAYLVQTEFRLAKSELAESVSAAGGASVYLALGAVVALAGLVALLFDAAQWITRAGLAYEWSLLIVAAVALAIGGLLAMAGTSRLRRSAFVPERTLEQMRADYETAREHVR